MNSLLKIFLIVLLILFMPLVAMQFTDEVDWGLGDFMVGGILLFVAGVAIDLVFRRVDRKGKWVLVIFILIILGLVWMELAVGIFD